MVKKEQSSEIQIQHGYKSPEVYPLSDPLLGPEMREIKVLGPSEIREGSTFLKYSRVALGLVAAVFLLFPLTILPGLIVVILPTEIALIGRVYDVAIEGNSEEIPLHRLPRTSHQSALEIEETAIRPSGQNPYST